PAQEANFIAGENLDVVVPLDQRYNYSEEYFVRSICRRDCSAVCKPATPYDSTLSTMADELASKIAADLETRLSMAVQRRKPYPSYGGPTYYKYPQGTGHGVHSLDDWVMRILKWTDSAEDTDDDNADSYSADRDNPTEFANIRFGMFPLSSSVESQAVPAPHLIVANVEIGKYLDDYNKAEQKLVRKIMALFVHQHNRRFAWGLAASCRTIHTYVFGSDDIWQSNKLDFSGIEGRHALISLLVNWSLCSVDRFGFDPTLRYVVGGRIGDPYLEMDVYEMDGSTGQMEKRTYYSKQCIRAAKIFTGCRERYFAVSTSPEMLSTPEFLVKDMWAILVSGSSSDMCESSFFNELHAEFDSSSEFSGKFSLLVSTGPVYIRRGDSFVADSTATAFAGLWSIAQDAAMYSSNVHNSPNICARQHRRAVLQWAGNPISAADNPSQIVVAIADAMVAFNEAYVKCKILHSNISDRAILFQGTAEGVKGVLGKFDYASHSGDSANAVPVYPPLGGC
ncbi:hypothetical protein GGI17_002319, partial [Coemansia sp. S146]